MSDGRQDWHGFSLPMYSHYGIAVELLSSAIKCLVAIECCVSTKAPVKQEGNSTTNSLVAMDCCVHISMNPSVKQ